MPTKYTRPSCESIVEDSEDESEDEPTDRRGEPPSEVAHRPSRPSPDTNMKGSYRKEKARSRRTHKSSSTSSKHSSRPEPKADPRVDPRSPVGIYPRGNGSDGGRSHRRSSRTQRDNSSSSSGEEEHEQVHQEVLAQSESRLNSPSTISALTIETVATNTSSSSSGSNSTVTQSSLGNKGKEPEVLQSHDVSMSPAAPDAPGAFNFVDQERKLLTEHPNYENHEEEDDSEESNGSSASSPNSTPQSPQLRGNPVETSLSPPLNLENGGSSASSSAHGDDAFDEQAADNDDTDRSTSPELSIKGQYEHLEAPQPPPADQFSAKIRSQMAAAQQRQQYYASQPYVTPEMPRGNPRPPCASSTVSTSRYQQPYQQPQPYPVPVQQQQQFAVQRVENFPVTGYELLAMRLTSDEHGPRIKPMYRKFEALNHRLLLHLQDELAELEEQLRCLDDADTQARCTPTQILPASRRLSAKAGGQLEWHKVDLLGRVGFKLSQYNQALASFKKTQTLSPADAEDVDNYRSYLQNERPIDDSEAHFLDPVEDLVSISSSSHRHRHRSHGSAPSSNISTRSSRSSPPSTRDHCSSPPPPFCSPPHYSSNLSHSHISTANSDVSTHAPSDTTKFQTLAFSLAISILLPIITFALIPSIIARISVAVLTAMGMVVALVHTGITRDMDVSFAKEGVLYLGLYMGVMSVLAGIVS